MKREIDSAARGVLWLGLFRTRGAAVAAGWVLMAVVINGGLNSWRAPTYPGLGNWGHGFAPPPSDAVYFFGETLRGATFALPLLAGLWGGFGRGKLGARVLLGVGAALLLALAPRWRWMAYLRWPSRWPTYLFVGELEVWLFALLVGLACRRWFGVTYGRSDCSTAREPSRWSVGDVLAWMTGSAVVLGAGVWFDRSTRRYSRLQDYLEHWLEPGYVALVALSVVLELITLAPLLWALLQEMRWRWLVPAGMVSCGLLSLKVALLGKAWLAYRSRPMADFTRLYPDALALAVGTVIAVTAVMVTMRWAGYRLRKVGTR